MFRFVRKMLIGLLSFSGSFTSMAKVSNFTTCISLYNKPCITKHTLINLNPYKCDQRLHYYSLMVN